MSKAVYRSALRSKRLLREAFSELLQEKDYGRITVTEIVERADLNRSTFYAHYTGIDDLMHELTDEITDGLMTVLQEAFSGDFLRRPEPALELLGNHLQQMKDLYRSLVRARQADFFMEELRRILTVRIQEELGEPKGLGADSLTSFLAGGVVSLYHSWLDDDYGDTDVSTVNEIAAAYVKAIGKAHAPLLVAER